MASAEDERRYKKYYAGIGGIHPYGKPVNCTSRAAPSLLICCLLFCYFRGWGSAVRQERKEVRKPGERGRATGKL